MTARSLLPLVVFLAAPCEVRFGIGIGHQDSLGRSPRRFEFFLRAVILVRRVAKRVIVSANKRCLSAVENEAQDPLWMRCREHDCQWTAAMTTAI